MRTFELCTPISEGEIRELKIGDRVFLTGTLVTARDAAHKRMMEYITEGRNLPFSLEGLVLYHCGPLVKRGDGWIILAAGPTTSMRMEPFEAEVIRNLRVRLIIGKGGMGGGTLDAMRRHGAAYGILTGGAAVLAADRIVEVKSVEWLDLGIPDAVWTLEVKRFGPIIVGMDSHGRSLYREAEDKALRNLRGILRSMNLG